MLVLYTHYTRGKLIIIYYYMQYLTVLAVSG